MKKPKVKLVGQDGNIFNLMGLCGQALKRAGQEDQYKEMTAKITQGCNSYNEALATLMEYCDVY
jgi:hypothetical protein